MGRPTKKEQWRRRISESRNKLTPEVITKLEIVYSYDATNQEIAFFVGVSERTLYNWRVKNKTLFERLDVLRSKPILKARQTIMRSLKDPKIAQWYLERKSRIEFFLEHKNENPSLSAPTVSLEDNQAIVQIMTKVLMNEDNKEKLKLFKHHNYSGEKDEAET